MKRFTPYTIGRGLSKLIASLVLSFVVAIAAGAIYADYQANHSTGIVQITNEEAAGLFTTLLAVVIAIPAIHSLRLGSTLGFQKQRVYVPELQMWLSHAGLALYNFVTKSPSANQQLKSDLINGKLKIQTFADSVKCTITSQSGNKEVFSAANSIYRQGRIPEILNSAELPEGTLISLSHMALAYATDASATVPEADVDYSRVVTAWPVALANGEFLIHQNGIKQRFMTKAAGSQGNSLQSAIESDGLEFDTPVVLEEKKQIKFEIRYAEGQAISGTNNHFLDICMLGAILTRKS